jgi:UDP-2,3-diacylglucosamine pyrophosphatase LpxH
LTATLVISDLHLGGRFFPGVLPGEAPLARLLAALDGADRLVLLGDTIELDERHPDRAMLVAEGTLRALGRRLGPEGEVVLVPGNHDFALVREWVRQTGPELGLAAPVPPDASPALARVLAWLAPARVSVRYPGVWLSDGIYATHGHYLDLHLRPVSVYGLPRDRFDRPPTDRATPAEYERARRHAHRRRSALASARRDGPRSEQLRFARHWVTRRMKAAVLRPRVSATTSALLGAQMLRVGLPAFAYVTERLDIDADWIIFGHVHRLGPLPGDDPARWRAPRSGARLLNTGSWLYEPLLIDRVAPPHPYWPGGAVLLEPGREPRAVSLLDGVGREQLRPGVRAR